MLISVLIQYYYSYKTTKKKNSKTFKKYNNLKHQKVVPPETLNKVFLSFFAPACHQGNNLCGHELKWWRLRVQRRHKNHRHLLLRSIL